MQQSSLPFRTYQNYDFRGIKFRMTFPNYDNRCHLSVKVYEVCSIAFDWGQNTFSSTTYKLAMMNWEFKKYPTTARSWKSNPCPRQTHHKKRYLWVQWNCHDYLKTYNQNRKFSSWLHLTVMAVNAIFITNMAEEFRCIF